MTAASARAYLDAHTDALERAAALAAGDPVQLRGIARQRLEVAKTVALLDRLEAVDR